jgi:methylated-DNA-[protein]-cysteine S-methyltransferase
MEPILIKNYKSAWGELQLGIYQEKICMVDWTYRKMRSTNDQRIKEGLKADFQQSDSAMFNTIIESLEAYKNGELKEFELPLLLVGTEFQREVWRKLLEIPYGQTWSYQDLALAMNNLGAIRAVAAANGANAISILVPCHRVIGSDGSLTGYAGGIPAKKQLLLLENPDFGKVDHKGQLSLF